MSIGKRAMDARKAAAVKMLQDRRASKLPAVAMVAAVMGSAAVSTEAPFTSVGVAANPLLYFREYQRQAFHDKTTKVLILEWSRQIGKSHTMANWAVDRVIQQLGRPEIKSWLVVVISNSKANGAEFALKVGEAGQAARQAVESIAASHGMTADEMSEFGIEVDDYQFKLSLTMRIDGVVKTGRIIVLAASPRTARGFTGDLILDEFAHHESARALWAAASPIISANPDFLCRICSTHSTTGSLFYKWTSTKFFKTISVKRSEAWAMSRNDPVAPLSIISLKTGKEITPDEARAEDDDQRTYDSNYENNPRSDSGSLISTELITQATIRGTPYWREPFREDAQEWRQSTLDMLKRIDGPLYAGMDVGRTKDISAVSVLHKLPDGKRRLVALLTMKGMPTIPNQSTQILRLLDTTQWIKKLMIDATGEGVGLTEYMGTMRGKGRVGGVDFRRYVDVTIGIGAGGKPIIERIPVTEQMGNDLLMLFRDSMIELPPGDMELENSLHQPEKVVSLDGSRVMLVSSKTKDEDGFTEHADRFWSVALAEHGLKRGKAGVFTAEDAKATMHSAPLFGGNHISFPPIGGDAMGLRFA